MKFDISEYKKSILGIFHELTEIEIKSTTDTINSDSEKYATPGASYLMAVIRCRQILELILKDKNNE
jgi:hypothetical protein